MAPLELFNLVTLATVVILTASFGVDPVNAVSIRSSISNGHTISHRSHGAVAKRRRSGVAKRSCRTRPQNGGNTTNTDDNNTNSSANGDSDNSNSSTDSNDSNNNNNTTSGGGSSNGGGAQGPSTGKVCLAWPNGNDPALANFATPNSGFLYTWSPVMPSDLHGYKAAPMLWGPNQIDDFHTNVKQGSADHILGFNEPEMDGQSNLTPQAAADLWKSEIEPYASLGFKLVTPGVSSAPQSKPWLIDFVNACDTCTFDAVSVHFYGTSADDLIKYITDFHNTFQKPIWLTEYACQDFSGGPQCTPDEVSDFMDKVKAFAESTDWVHQYCWFGAMHDMVNVNPANQLMASDGNPTPLGKVFLGI
ncbi:hypothetical protein E1B28_004528 [Marasmius oreades]|uniref:Asl1-like glycosyl hydrolase catalytic domain-containing protein n=1 Tax=Marasmius oreades TaxID=181124 RepID=A0A9P7UYQ4_9AGAR|nr:uncharacterized protein E1B28_004528 [Marasmius oreades]KAG7097150.1 hypothetical protein E1B28_004528 [Marasmius oreades]